MREEAVFTDAQRQAECVNCHHAAEDSASVKNVDLERPAFTTVIPPALPAMHASPTLKAAEMSRSMAFVPQSVTQESSPQPLETMSCCPVSQPHRAMSRDLHLWALKRKLRLDCVARTVIGLLEIEGLSEAPPPCEPVLPALECSAGAGCPDNQEMQISPSAPPDDSLLMDSRSDAGGGGHVDDGDQNSHITNCLSTGDAYYYACCLFTAYHYTANGRVPPAPLTCAVAELLSVDQARKLIGKYPRLATLLGAEGGETESSEKHRKQLNGDESCLGDLLCRIVARGEGASLDRLLYIPDGLKHVSSVSACVFTKHADMLQRAEVELRMLRLRQFQAKVRRRVITEMEEAGPQQAGAVTLSQFLLSQGPTQDGATKKKKKAVAKVCSSSLPACLQKVSLQCKKRLRRPPAHDQMLRTKLDRLLEDFPLTFRALKKRWCSIKEKWKLAAAEMCKRVEAISTRREVVRERERKQRMKLLKEQDFVKYLELVKESKNARIEELLTQTDRFLETVSLRVSTQQLATAQSKETQQQRATQQHRLSRRETVLPPSDSAFGTTSESTAVAAEDERRNSCESLRGEKLYRSVLLGESEKVTQQPSILVGGALMPYQLAGLQFLVSLYNADLSGILADEMGLGKTIQAISLLAYLKECKNIDGPHLIIVPLSTLPNWVAEFEKWCPMLSVVQFRGNKLERRELARVVKRSVCNVCVTTYDWVIREKGILSAPHWTYIIVDEGHRMKNFRSKFHVTLAEFRSTHRLLLTGTPLQNNLTELWSLLNFLLPKIFTSAVDFEHWFEEPFRDFPGQEAELTEEEKFLIINRLHCVLRPFLLRRVKSDVLDDLPEKREYIVRVQLSAWQQRAYDQLSKKVLRIQDTEGKISSRCFANVIMQLRKIVNHPYLFEGEYFVNKDLYRTSGKFEVLDRMLPKLLHFGHKVLIFSQMTQLMDILDDYLELKGYKRARLDGTTSLEDRRDRVEEFNNSDSDTNVFVLSTRAGGLGLNLQAADTVIIFDSDWNPHQDLQAQARAHRLGQKREVRVFRLVTVSGVEEAILSKAQHKLDIDEKIIQAGMFNNRVTDEEREERLRTLLCSKDLRRESPSYDTSRKVEEEYFQAFDAQLFGAEAFRKFEEKCELSQKPSSPGVKLLEVLAKQKSKATANTRSDRSRSRKASTKKAQNGEETQRRVMTPRRTRDQPVSRDDSFLTEEALLIHCDRLMSTDELPPDWILSDHSETLEEPTELSRDSRRSRLSSRGGPGAEAAVITEAAFTRALKTYEDGKAPDFETALLVEKAKQESRRSHRELITTLRSNDETDSVSPPPSETLGPLSTSRKRRRRDTAEKEDEPCAARNRPKRVRQQTNTSPEPRPRAFSAPPSRRSRTLNVKQR